MARSKRPPPRPEPDSKKKASTGRTGAVTKRIRPVDPREEVDDDDWGPPASIKLSPESRRPEVSLPPIEVDPSWVSLHTLAPAPPSVRHPTQAPVPVRKGPPPLPPPMTIPVESNWIDDEVHDDPDAAARAALLRPKAVRPPPIPRLPKK